MKFHENIYMKINENHLISAMLTTTDRLKCCISICAKNSSAKCHGIASSTAPKATSSTCHMNESSIQLIPSGPLTYKILSKTIKEHAQTAQQLAGY